MTSSDAVLGAAGVASGSLRTDPPLAVSEHEELMRRGHLS
jgi:hypothetical protein